MTTTVVQQIDRIVERRVRNNKRILSDLQEKGVMR